LGNSVNVYLTMLPNDFFLLECNEFFEGWN
jgi:hypothetical protein